MIHENVNGEVGGAQEETNVTYFKVLPKPQN